MFVIELQVTNEGAKDALTEIRQFLRFETNRMVGPKGGRAATGYVVLRRLAEKLQAHLNALEVRENERREEVLREGTRPVLERRRVRGDGT